MLKYGGTLRNKIFVGILEMYRVIAHRRKVSKLLPHPVLKDKTKINRAGILCNCFQKLINVNFVIQFSYFCSDDSIFIFYGLEHCTHLRLLLAATSDAGAISRI